MSNIQSIPIVDLFAGPGGLGEGFSSLNSGNAFEIVTSVEKDPHAHQTLLLRAFFRNAKKRGKKYLDSYYAYCNGESESPWDKTNRALWDLACEEAMLAELGTKSASIKLEKTLEKNGISPDKPWVLIGGPPCQAYSLVGRSRNQGKSGYVAEEDHRHFLYREYLSVIRKFSPSVFVMENVKGILSSKINSKYIFPSILKDLANPSGTSEGPKYRIHSLSCDIFFENGMDPISIDPKKYVIRAEDYGIPQARHRVILLGIREDLEITPTTLQRTLPTTLDDAIAALPRIRSTLSKRGRIDSKEESIEWLTTYRGNITRLINEIRYRPDMKDVGEVLKMIDPQNPPNNSGSTRIFTPNKWSASKHKILNEWYGDENLKMILNHEARSHMRSDLLRYLYASAFARARGKSPKGHTEFDLDGLSPDHKNWETGKFSDRFRVQQHMKPATTITSHISKDGHYFIHPDPAQCRSLTVREAARIQTFPDNYYFKGNRTQQYHQVGNAVPPLLARKIAEVVLVVLEEKTAF